MADEELKTQGWLVEPGSCAQVALLSTSNRPNILPSGSMKYPCQHFPGIANLGIATWPPSAAIREAVRSKSATSMEHVNAFVPIAPGGAEEGRFKIAPEIEVVSIR